MSTRLPPVEPNGRTSRLVAPVAVCALALGILIGAGASSKPHALDEGLAPASAPGTAWSADHARIEETARPVETF